MAGDRGVVGRTGVLFGAVGVFVSSLTRALHHARTRAELTADDLRRAREEAERANLPKTNSSPWSLTS